MDWPASSEVFELPLLDGVAYTYKDFKMHLTFHLNSVAVNFVDVGFVAVDLVSVDLASDTGFSMSGISLHLQLDWGAFSKRRRLV